VDNIQYMQLYILEDYRCRIMGYQSICRFCYDNLELNLARVEDVYSPWGIPESFFYTVVRGFCDNWGCMGGVIRSLDVIG